MTAELLVETDAIIERASESETAVYLYSPFHLFCISIRKNWLNFCGAPVPDTVSGSLSIFLTIADWGILGDLLAYLMQLPADFYESWRIAK